MFLNEVFLEQYWQGNFNYLYKNLQKVMKTNLQILFIAVFCFISMESYGLDTLNVKLLNHAKSVPDSTSKTIENLTKYLIEATNSDFEKAEIIFYWIAENIEYDVKASKTRKSFKNYHEAFTRKRGVPRTFSALFKQMCKLAKIECFIISGYAKGDHYNPKLVFTKANHAWNIVQIDGLYYFVDTAWGSGRLIADKNDFKYQKKMALDQILTREEEFLYNHLPIDPRWQLRDSIIQMDDFIHFKDLNHFSSSSIYYNYLDSIAHFIKLSEEERITMTFESANRFYPTYDNLIKLGHHIYNRAHKRSLGKVKRPDLEESNKLYRKAITVYEKVQQFDPKIGSWIERAYEGIQYNQYYLNRMRK